MDVMAKQLRALADALIRRCRRALGVLRLAWIVLIVPGERAEGRVPAPTWQRMRALGFAEDVDGRVVPLSDEEARAAFGDSRAVGWAQSYSGDREEAVGSLRRAVVGLAVEKVKME